MKSRLSVIIVSLWFIFGTGFACDDSSGTSNNGNNINNTNNSNNSNNTNNTNSTNNANNVNNINNDAGTDADVIDPEPPLGVLELNLLTIWGTPLPQLDVALSVTSPQGDQLYSQQSTPWPGQRFFLHTEGTYIVSMQTPHYYPVTINVNFTPGGTSTFTLTRAVDDPGHGLSVTYDTTTQGGEELPLASLYLGQRHKWFSSTGRPARYGNTIQLFTDPESTWINMRQDILAATDTILWTSWWWDSEFELYRDPVNHIYSTEAERWENTILATMEQSTALKRVLIGEFWGSHEILDWLTTDTDLLAHAETPNDNFQFMGQGNPTSDIFWFEPASFTFLDRVLTYDNTLSSDAFDAEEPIPSAVPSKMVDFSDSPIGLAFQIASWHQKIAVFDNDLAWVGGMNVKDVNWDTPDLLVFEPRRMAFDASESDRIAVMNKEQETDFPPRKDFFLRIHGPAAQDVSDVFKMRWDTLLSEGAEYAENNTPFTYNPDIAAQFGGSQVQITTTMPEPYWEHSIAESWFNAINQAEEYILIEDQYWRIPHLLDTVIERMRLKPDLKLVVVTIPVGEWTDGGCYWTYEGHERLMNEFPDRYALYQLRSFDYVTTWGWDETESRFADIYVHSKMLIVDDTFLSVGSCNKNNRGIIYEGELNAAVVDPVWVKEQRRRLLSFYMPAKNSPSDDADIWFSQLVSAALWNDEVYARWDDEGWDIDNGDGSAPLPTLYTPDGHLYGYNPPEPTECAIENLSPDLF